MFPSSHQLQKSRRESSFREWKRPRGLLAWLWSNYVVVQHFSKCVTISFLCFTTNSVLVLLLVLCEVSVLVLVHLRIQAKIVTGLSWEHFQTLIFCAVIAHSFPFLPLLRHICAPDMYWTTEMHVTMTIMVQNTQNSSEVWHMNHGSSIDNNWLLKQQANNWLAVQITGQ